jgi:hypothetical protein
MTRLIIALVLLSSVAFAQIPGQPLGPIEPEPPVDQRGHTWATELTISTDTDISAVVPSGLTHVWLSCAVPVYSVPVGISSVLFSWVVGPTKMIFRPIGEPVVVRVFGK